MTKWPDTDYATIRQFLRHQRLRPASVKTYQPMLAEFQQYVLDNSPEQCVSRPVLEKWLYHRATFSATHTILQRVWPIDCFLDWLADRRLITSNPLADLRKDLGTNEYPAMGHGLIDGDLAFRQHDGGHTPAPNWPYFLEFASRYLHAPKVPER